MYRLFILCFLFISCQSGGNKTLPDFNKVTLSGKAISNKNLLGKTVVVKVWATWCRDCIVELSSINKVVAKYKTDTNVVFLSITDDTADKVNAFLNRHTFDYEHITDAKKLKSKFYTGLIEEIPKHLVINPKGEVIYESAGEIKNIAAILEEKISSTK